MTQKPKSNRGGKRPGAGRPAGKTIPRLAKLHIKTTTSCAAWFKLLAKQRGGLGPALESLQKENQTVE
jgi:hypothetical protein